MESYLASVPEDRRGDMEALHAILSDVFPDGGPVVYEGRFWGGSEQTIVGYQPFSSRRSDGTEVEWFVVGMALQKNYISLYVSAVEDGEYLSRREGPSLGKVKVGSSAVSFRSLDDVDREALVRFLEKARDLSG